MSKRTPKVAVVIPYYFAPPKNGGHHAAFGFCEALSKVMDVVVVSTKNNRLENLPFRLMPLFADHWSKYLNPLVALRLWRFFHRERITASVVQQPFFGLLALPICRLLKIRSIIYVHNIEFQRFKTIGVWWWRGIYWVERLIYRRADHLFFISPDDQALAIPIFRLKPERCTVIPYGTRLKAMPAGRAEARQKLAEKHRLAPDEMLLLFFGPQSYQPNLEAVERIVFGINPILLSQAPFRYRIFICGGGLPEKYNRFTNYREQRIEYLGFVEDINLYIQAADIILNPVLTGGGVKTKVIEAIALGATVISSRTGARGIDISVCGSKLQIVEDADDSAFAQALLQLATQAIQPVPTSFYEKYYWDRIIQPAIVLLSS